MSKIKVGEDINTLLGEVRDYISDAITQLDSANDKLFFLDLDFSDPEVNVLLRDVKTLLVSLRAQKRKASRIQNEVTA